MKKLISMTDFVLAEKLTLNIKGYEKEFISNVSNYAKFLKKPLELGMFVPVGEDGRVLEEPHNFGLLHTYPTGDKLMDQSFESAFEYQKAKEKVLFDGFRPIGERHVEAGDIVIGLGYKNGIHQTIEDLVMYHKSKYLILTESAIKQLGL
jgi:hypothetical protein